jgi:hypothetical protein
MDVAEETTNKPDAEEQQPSTSKTGRPPPIVLTSTTNLMQLQRQVKTLSRAVLSSATPGARPELLRKKWQIFSHKETPRDPQPFLLHLFPNI